MGQYINGYVSWELLKDCKYEYLHFIVDMFFIICIYQNWNLAENLHEGVKKFNRYLKSINEIQSRFSSFCNTFLPIVTINF